MTRRLNSLLILAVLVGVAHAAPEAVNREPKVKLAWNKFYDVPALQRALEQMRDAHPGWLTLRSLGKSVEGRDVWLATVTDPESAPHDQKPGIYIDGNIHGNEIQAADTCLYTVWYLLENRDRPRVKALLKRVAFYVIPSVNPDGRQGWFDAPNTAHSPRTGLQPTDNDRDGRLDEDGPNDLDGDGSITRMRKRVPLGEGTHRLDRDDPRVMIRVQGDEKGDWIMLGSEGVDDDADGAVNEDGAGGYDMNRNFPSAWRPSWIQRGAGDYPLCFPETRAIGAFLMERPNIAAFQAYHNAGGMILRGPGDNTVPEYPGGDLQVYGELAKTGEAMLPHYRYLVIWQDLYSVFGGLVNWGYEGLGIFSFTNELWSNEQYGGALPENASWTDIQKRRLKWDDRLEMGRQFVEWKAFGHPEYGDIEIGGWRKTGSRVPPTFMLEELCHRNAMFTLYHAGEMPELSIGEPEITAVGEGLWRVRAEVRNARLIPTIASIARQKGMGLPDFFQIEGVTVVAGGILRGPAMREKVTPQEHRANRLRIEGGVPSRGKVRVEWIVASETKPAPKLSYRSEKGGTLYGAR